MRRAMVRLSGALPLLLIASAAVAALTPREQLGKELFFDKISSPDHVSCASCHAPSMGFTGPIPGFNAHGAVYPGAVPQRFGNRKPPSAAYATLSPNFHYDPIEELFVGGNFWDGRATGEHLGNPAADQALGPFLNPVEQNNPSKRAVLEQVAASKYAPLWEMVWGEPLAYGTPAEIDLNYDRIGLAIASYEASTEVNTFTSKYDYYLKGMVQLTPLEKQGLDLFNSEDKGNCAACHVPPLFTDFTFDNLGTPKNPENPFYGMDEVFLPGGDAINPLGDAWIDPGLGGYLSSLPPEYFTNLGLDKATVVAENMGKQKVPTLRNVDRRPGNGTPKAYMHNGALKSLKEVVSFYNTRDVMPWPAPEVAANVNHDELGDLGLTDEEEDAIVAFMATLSDGYVIGRRGRIAQPGPSSALALVVPDGARSGAGVRIAYTVPGATRVRIDAFDVTGRRVATLVNERMAAGSYAADWATGGLASGLYFLRMEVGTASLAKKVLIAR